MAVARRQATVGQAELHAGLISRRRDSLLGQLGEQGVHDQQDHADHEQGREEIGAGRAVLSTVSVPADLPTR